MCKTRPSRPIGTPGRLSEVCVTVQQIDGPTTNRRLKRFVGAPKEVCKTKGDSRKREKKNRRERVRWSAAPDAPKFE